MRRSVWFVPLVLSLAAGCARGPNVGSEQLPLRRVVIYRNGVGYFERAGVVDDERVTFEMRQRMVGDFLASLAIVERGGSSVRSASFPLQVEETQTPGPGNGGPWPEPPRPEPRPSPWQKDYRPLPRPDEPPQKPADSNAMREVVLHLDGGEHDLAIGYLAETPVWRPSYRVVVFPDGSADLQAWGIVQNLSGEDWTNVQLSLVAGAPLAFQSTLGTPIVPERPVVSDEGEIIAAMPTGVTSLDSRDDGEVERVGPDEAPPPAAPAMAEADGAADQAADEEAEVAETQQRYEVGKRYSRRAAPKSGAGMGLSGIGAGGGGRAAAQPSASAPSAAPKPMPPPAPPSPPRRLSDLAAIAVESGTTRYDIPKAVTVPNESATMVMLTSQRVPGATVFLFAPDPGVAPSAMHPFRVARFTNATPGLLERGPIAVFERGSFLGQGLLEPLPPRATATVPFALERSVAITTDRRDDYQGARLHRIEAAQLWIEQDQVQRTIYKIDHGGDKPAKLLVKHPRNPGTRLFRPPPATEDNAGTLSALVPVELKPRSKTELTVDERRAVQLAVDWLSPLADDAVRAYMGDPRARVDVVAKLREAWAIREALRRSVDEQQKLAVEQQQLERASEETRHSLRAIEKNTQAADLRAKLTRRLGELTTRLEQLTKRLIEVQMTINEQQVRFRDAIHDLRLDSGLPPPA